MSGVKGKSGVYPRTSFHRTRISLSKIGHLISEDTKKKIGIANKKPSKYSPQEKEQIIKARRILNNAIRFGKMIRGICHCGTKAEAHHPDYSKPLDVIWLCRIHHERYHRNKLLSKELIK